MSNASDALRDLESVLDPSDGHTPPSPPRSASFLKAPLKSRMPGWSPHIGPAEEGAASAQASSAGALPDFDLGDPAAPSAGSSAIPRPPTSVSSARSPSDSASALAPSSSSSSSSSSAKVSKQGGIRSRNGSASTSGATSAQADPNADGPALTEAEIKARKKAEKKARAAAFAQANPNAGKKKAKPKLSKAERRAKQEAQRAAKAAQKADGGGKGGKTGNKAGRGENKTNKKKGTAGSESASSSSSSRGANASDPGSTSSSSSSSSTASAVRVNAMFSHLKPYLRTPAPPRPRRFATRGTVIHPAFSRIGLMFSQGTITGGNARCVALLQACQEAINDYAVPPSQDFCRAFLEHLNQMISFIVTCRPMSISMGNAIRYLKRIIAAPGARRLGEDDVRVYLCAMIDEFIDKRIKSADELIMRNLLGLEPHTTPKIVDGDVVLTHGRSHVVEEALKYAHSLNTRFRVVVVDSRPRMEGRGLLKSLAEHGIQCTYVLLSAVSYVMKDVTKVILGAAAMMANGTALSRVGTAVVAMMAHTQRRPVIFCCETYKFSERVQMDGIVSNEVADPADLIKDKDGRATSLEGWEEVDHMGVLNLSYDLTPQEFITVIVTDVGNIPTTSVPVIIREFIAEGVLDDQ